MIDPQSLDDIRAAIRAQVAGDRPVLDNLRDEVKVLKPDVRRIQPRQTTSVSLVGTDGGNNQLQFDPFLIQVLRVVDSSNNELFLDVISPTADVTKLSARQFTPDKSGKIPPLGRLMEFLGVKNLWFFMEFSGWIRGKTSRRAALEPQARALRRSNVVGDSLKHA